MINKIAIIGNGTIKDFIFHKKLLIDVDIIICADGGSNNAKKMNITPDYIIGDLDSSNTDVLEYFKNKKTKIIEDDNQNKTDLELAIHLAESLKPKEIIILGGIGYRIDHTIANILCLNKIKSNIKSQIIDNKNSIELVKNTKEIVGNKDDIISIIPLSEIIGLTYKGLKWKVNDKNTKIGWFGISNELKEKKANISLKKGKLLLIRVRD